MATEIHPTAVVGAKAAIGVNVTIGPYCVINDRAEIGDGCMLESHVMVYGNTSLGAGCVVSPFASLGGDPQDLKYNGEETFAQIGANCRIREYVTVNRGTPGDSGVTKVGEGCLLMAASHIAHDCQVGREVILANEVALAGHVLVEDCAIIGGITAVHQFARIGAYAYIGGMSAIPQDVPPYVIAVGRGDGGFLHGLNKIGLKRRGFSDETIAALKKAYRLFFRLGLTVPQAVERIKAEIAPLPEVQHLLDFMQTSKRGISR